MIDTDALRQSAIEKTALVALPLLLAGAILFGGAMRGSELTAIFMQVLACLILLWVVNWKHEAKVHASTAVLSGIVALFLATALLQLVPLPPEYWTQVKGRETIEAAFQMSGLAPAWMPISLAPQSTVSTLFCFLPAIAAFFLVTRSNWRSISACADWVIPIGAALSAMLGLLQIVFPDIPLLFPYGRTVTGQAQGVMRVVNHNATLLLMAIPFLASTIRRIWTEYELGNPDHARAIFAGLLLALIAGGIAATGSVAGYLIAVPVCLFSAFIVVNPRKLFSTIATGAVIFLGLGALVLLVTNSPAVSGLGLTDLSDSPLARRTVYTNTYLAVVDHFPFGSGLGTFGSVYPMYEDPSLVGSAFIQHAHSDYLEISVELGALGMLTMLAGLIWIAVRSVLAWRAADIAGRRIRCSASIACFVVVAHSMVDSPLRTETVACLFAFCLAVLSLSPGGRNARTTVQINAAHARHKHLAI